MAQLYDPFHPCPLCKQPTDNESWCDDCIDKMAFTLVRRYEADMRDKPELRKSDHNKLRFIRS